MQYVGSGHEGSGGVGSNWVGKDLVCVDLKTYKIPQQVNSLLPENETTKKFDIF